MIIFKAKLVSFKKQLTQYRVEFSTKEDFDPLIVLQNEKTEGWLAFNKDQFKIEVEKAMADRKIAVDDKGLSKSQKFRGILFSIWNKTPESDKRTFEQFYSDEYNKIMSHYIEKYLK